eukprot:g2891.t1
MSEMKELTASGYFREEIPNCVGDTSYGLPDGKDKRLEGKRQFQTSPQKKGQLVDNWGNKEFSYPRLFEGEKYVEPSKQRQLDRMKAAKKNVSEKAFVPSSISKKSASAGDYYGTFSKPWKNYPDGRFDKLQRKKDVEEKDFKTTRNIVTNPVQKGKYTTYPGLLMGGKNISYVGGDNDDDLLKVAKAERDYHIEKVGDRPAFKPGNQPSRGAMDASRIQGVSSIYTRDEKCLPLKPEQSKKSASKDGDDERKPYAPPNAHGKKFFGHVRKADGRVLQHPEWKPDECDTTKVKKAQQPLRLASEETRKKFMDPKLRDRSAFKPSSVSKTKKKFMRIENAVRTEIFRREWSVSGDDGTHLKELFGD